MDAKHESEALINELLPLARKMLREYGEFYPYAGYIRPDGKIVELGADDPDADRPKSKDFIFLLGPQLMCVRISERLIRKLDKSPYREELAKQLASSRRIKPYFRSITGILLRGLAAFLHSLFLRIL